MTAIVKFCPEVRGGILAAVKLGVTYERAAETAGISRMTLFRWLTQGRADESAGLDTEQRRFFDAFHAAEAGVVGAVEISLVQTATSGDDCFPRC